MRSRAPCRFRLNSAPRQGCGNRLPSESTDPCEDHWTSRYPLAHIFRRCSARVVTVAAVASLVRRVAEATATSAVMAARRTIHSARRVKAVSTTPTVAHFHPRPVSLLPRPARTANAGVPPQRSIQLLDQPCPTDLWDAIPCHGQDFLKSLLLHYEGPFHIYPANHPSRHRPERRLVTPSASP